MISIFNIFGECTGLTEVVIPDSVTELQYVCEDAMYGAFDVNMYGAFGSCTNLTKVVLPRRFEESIENIFHDCPNLTEIVYY